MINAVAGIAPLALDLIKDMTGANTGTSLTPGSAAGQTGSPSFSSIMNGITTDMVKDLRTAESTSLDGMMGKASTREVVDAVMAADRSLQTATAFRDKIVSAYLEITKMPI
jgi:flagellar hook-basal body complex protein FliE